MSLIWLLFFSIFIVGCQTAAPKHQETKADTISALTAVTQGLTNKPVTEAQLNQIGQQVANDPQAQSALRAINSGLAPLQTVKYCPENGQRFSADQIWCPDHKVKLEWVE